MIIRRIQKEELMESRNISAFCFEWSHNTNGQTKEEYAENILTNPNSKENAFWEDTWAAFTDEAEMMAEISAYPYQVMFDGTYVSMRGIGGVCTYPQFRRKGAVREIFKKLLPELYKKDVLFSYLYPFSEKFYGNYGYHRSISSIEWTFSMHTIPDFNYKGNFVLYRGDQEFSLFEQAYQLFASNYNMMVKRDSHDWKNLKNAVPFHGSQTAYVYLDEKKVPCGYLIYGKQNRDGKTILNCNEIVFDSFETLKALFRFVKSYSADYDFFRFFAPRNLSLEYFCEDYSQSDSTRVIKQNGMARVINVPLVLRQAHYIGSGSLKILIHDPIILENNAVFTVSFKNGKAIELTWNTLADAETADIEIPINEFSSAILGNYEAADFAYMDHVKLNCSLKDVSKIFYQKPCWINNFF